MASSEAVTIFVDDREPDWVADKLSRFDKIAVAKTRLEAGDYCFFAHGLKVLVERKTISNLLGSMADKQLVGQAHKMVEQGDLSILLREGEYRREVGNLAYKDSRHPDSDSDGWVSTGWSWESFQGIMFDLQLLGLKFYDAVPLGSAPYEIARLVQSLNKTGHKWVKERQRPSVVVLDTQYRDAVWSLCAFKGCGPEMAQALLAHFGSWLNVAVNLADCPEKVAVVVLPGKKQGRKIGMATAKKLQEAVNAY